MMSFCPTCGRQRTGDSRFCGGCGSEFREPTSDGGTVPADATRVEPSAAGSAPEEPDPFAAWFASPAPAGQPAPPREEPRAQWQTADTVQVSPGQSPGYPAAYPPPSQPGAAFPPPQAPVHDAPARQPSRGARAAFILVAILVVLAAGGGAYALFPRSNGHSPLTSPSTVTTSATPATSTSTSTSAAASASPSPSLVSIASGVGANPATQPVETVLSHYFQGINTHSYTEYSSALDAQEQGQRNQTRSSFDSGYSTTTDSGMTLTSLTSTGGGDLAAIVTFTSRQSPSESVDKSACNHWTLTFSLVPQGAGYLIGPNPSGYQPTYSDC